MPLSREAIYNDLNGEEAKQILAQRFASLLDRVPWLQRHLTLPRVRMTLSVKFELFADQPTPEVQQIDDECVLRSESVSYPPPSPDPGRYIIGIDPRQESLNFPLPDPPPDLPSEVTDLMDEVDASPSGSPPGAVRMAHSLPVPTPHRGVQTVDIPVVEDLSRATAVPGVHIGHTESKTVARQDYGGPRLTGTGPAPDPVEPPIRNRDNRDGPTAGPNFRNFGR